MNEHQEWWAGEAGNAYTESQVNRVPANVALFARALTRTQGIERIVELGAGTGMNLEALRRLLPHTHLQACEVNAKAAEQIAHADSVFCCSIFDFKPAVETPADLAFCKGLLIHIQPADLPAAYDKLYACSIRYVLMIEYYNPTPLMIQYRGENDRLWKRDFAGEMMERYSNLKLLDYGWVWKRDPNWPQDDVTWFLLERR